MKPGQHALFFTWYAFATHFSGTTTTTYDRTRVLGVLTPSEFAALKRPQKTPPQEGQITGGLYLDGAVRICTVDGVPWATHSISTSSLDRICQPTPRFGLSRENRAVS